MIHLTVAKYIGVYKEYRFRVTCNETFEVIFVGYYDECKSIMQTLMQSDNWTFSLKWNLF